MKALVVEAIGRGFEVADVEIAKPIGREVLVEVRASGLCHTDLLMATHDIVPLPAVLGHEVAGVVAAVGPEVGQVRLGDHVVGSLAQSCGTCVRCVAGRSFQCRHPESTLRRSTDAPRLSRNGVAVYQGFGLGGFAERALIHENQLALVPKELPFAQAALLGCGVVTGAGSVLNTANVSAGDSVVIFGAGGVGLNAVSGARIAGASKASFASTQTARRAATIGATDVTTGAYEPCRSCSRSPAMVPITFGFVAEGSGRAGTEMLCAEGTGTRRSHGQTWRSPSISWVPSEASACGGCTWAEQCQARFHVTPTVIADRRISTISCRERSRHEVNDGA
jgi:Zn-dependent alcohol dehydrogenase